MSVDVLPHINQQPNYGLQRGTQTQVDKISYGDGYEQRRARDINTNRRVYSVSWGLLDQDSYNVLYDFLSSRVGVYSFFWTVPDTGEQVRVVAEEITDQYTGYKTFTLGCTLREVFER